MEIALRDHRLTLRVQYTRHNFSFLQACYVDVSLPLGDAMNASPAQKIAIIIESSYAVAAVVESVLLESDYHVVISVSHRNAVIKAQGFPSIHLLAACVPAADDEQLGSYLAHARATQQRKMAVVLMLSDNVDAADDAPEFAQRLFKPFGRDEFTEALCLAEWKVLEL